MKNENLRYYSIALIIIGLLIIIVFSISLIVNEYCVSFSQDLPIQGDITGQVGDFIGGVVGTLWALAGVLLFYHALTLQKEEFKEHQKQFSKQTSELILNRLTDLIFRQITELNHQIDNLSIEINKYKYGGMTAIIKLTEGLRINKLYDRSSRYSEAELDGIFQVSNENSLFLNQYSDFILNLYQILEKNIQSILYSINTHDVEGKDQAALKEICKLNIGEVTIKLLTLINQNILNHDSLTEYENKNPTVLNNLHYINRAQEQLAKINIYV